MAEAKLSSFLFHRKCKKQLYITKQVLVSINESREENFKFDII